MSALRLAHTRVRPYKTVSFSYFYERNLVLVPSICSPIPLDTDLDKTGLSQVVSQGISMVVRSRGHRLSRAAAYLIDKIN